MENKRIASTIVLIIFLALTCFLCCLSVGGVLAVTDTLANPNPPESTGDGTTDVIMFGAVALVVGFGFLFALALAAVTIIVSLICLGFSIRNARAENKPVKIINIILSCLFAAGAALGIIAIILLRVL